MRKPVPTEIRLTVHDLWSVEGGNLNLIVHSKETEFTFRVTAHARAGHFSVPEVVCNLLGIGEHGTARGPSGLCVRKEDGRVIFHGVWPLRSGTEVYSNRGEFDLSQVISPEEKLTVTAWKPVG
jgi:hypothetical protein